MENENASIAETSRTACKPMRAFVQSCNVIICKAREGFLVHVHHPVHDTSVRNQRDRPAIGSYTSQSHMWVGGGFRAARPVKLVQQKLAGKLHMRASARDLHEHLNLHALKVNTA